MTRLRREVNAAAAKVTAKIGVTVKTTGLRTELRRAVKEAAEKSKVAAKIGVRIPVADFRRAVREVAEKAKAQAKIGVRIPVTEMRRAVKEAGDKAQAKVRVDADTKPARRAIDALKHVRVKLNADTSDFNAQLKKAASAAASLGMVVAKGLGLAVVAAGAAAGAANLVSFAAAAVTAAQSAGLLPAVVGAYVGVMATFKLALSGVGDAIKESFNAYSKLAAGQQLSAAEQEKLNAALDKLAPSARATVGEIMKLAPAFDALRLDVQERFFAGLNSSVKSLGERYLPVLKTGFGQISSEINGGLRQALADLDTEANSSSLLVLLNNTAAAGRRVFEALGPIGSALLRIGEIGSGFLPGLTSGLADWAQRFADGIERAAEDGRLQQWISDGLSMLGQLATMGRNVVGILKGVFAAADAAGGGGAFGLVSQVLAVLNEAANSAGGQQALIAVFTALGQVGSALAPVLTAVVSGLAPLATIIGELATAASPGLTVLINALAEGLRLLAPAAAPVGRALSEVARAVAPLLPLLGAQLANILIIAAGALSNIARQAGPLIGVWARMGVQLATTLLPVLQELVAGGLGPATQAGLAIAKAFMPLVPVIVQLARVIAGQLIQYLPQMQAMLTQLVPVLAQAADELGQALLEALLALAPQIPSLVAAGVQLAMAFTQLLVAVIPLLPYLVQVAVLGIRLSAWLAGLVPVIALAATGFVRALGAVRSFGQTVAGAASSVGQFLTRAWAFIQGVGSAIGRFFTVTVPGWISGAVAWFAALPGRIGAALAALPGQLIGLLQAALTQAAYWVGYGIGLIIAYVVAMPGQAAAAFSMLVTAVSNAVTSVLSWLGSLPDRASAIIADLWARAQALFSAGVAAVVDFAYQLPGRLSSAVSDARSRVTGAFSSMWNTVRSTVSTGVDRTVSAVRGIPGRLGDLGSLLKKAGGQLIDGLVSGIESAVGRAVDAAKGVVNAAVKGAKDALGIKSPSRVFAAIGRQVVAGYTVGIDRNRPSAVKAAERLAGAVTGAASGAAPAPAPQPAAGDSTTTVAAPLVGQVTLQTTPGASVADQLEELMFQLRVIRRGGVVAGT